MLHAPGAESPRPIWLAAASMAARAHQGQLRKDGRTPYVAHVYRVTLIVRDLFGCDDEAALAAALLHDIIEDTASDYDDIAEAFGTNVADLVAALTKNMALPEDVREREYDDRLARADWRARLIKLADVYDNLMDQERRTGEAPETLARPINKAERALKLAARDRASHPESARAAELLRALLARLSGS